jgi:hypothetical protein
VASLQGLVWIAQKPQGRSRTREAAHLGVIQDTIGATVLGVVESKPRIS